MGPCQLCEAKFSNLYGVKTHIVETHENFNEFNVSLREGSPLSDSSMSSLNPQTKKLKNIKKNKFSSKKKPWCNFCWIKFRDMKSYQRHRQTLHPTLVNPNRTEDLKVKDEVISEGEENNCKKSPRKESQTAISKTTTIHIVKPNEPVSVFARVEEG